MKKFDVVKNPYTLQFSYIPPQFIERTLITNEIISNYIREVPTYRGIFITGVRGSGKTVIMGDIRNKIGALDDWITVDLNSESNLLDALARSLYLIPEIKALFVKAKQDFSVLGIGVHLENADLVASNEEDAIRMMLKIMKASGKKIDDEACQAIYQKLDITLSELAYEKIWDELSEGDRKVLKSMNKLLKKSDKSALKVDEIRSDLKMTSNTFTTYRKRLIDSGILDGKQYGFLSFRLPRFDKFIDMQVV